MQKINAEQTKREIIAIKYYEHPSKVEEETFNSTRELMLKLNSEKKLVAYEILFNITTPKGKFSLKGGKIYAAQKTR